MSSAPHTFDRTADETLARARQTYAGRGGEYGDTWALENQNFNFTRMVLRLGGDVNDLAWLRLLKLAALIDVKEDRLLGGWKDDHGIDSIAYRAAFTALMAEYPPSPRPTPTSKE